MSFDGENYDSDDPFESDYDPLVAEQFAVLDRLNVPDFGAGVSHTPAAVAFEAPRPRFDPVYALAVAAAFVVVAAASIFALRPSTELDVDATDGDVVVEDGTDSNNSAAVEDGGPGGESLTVEVSPSSTASAVEGAPSASDSTGPSEDEAGASSNAEQATTTTTQNTPATESTSSTGSATTAPADGADGSSTTIDALDPDSVFVTTTTKAGSQTSLDVPVTSFPADGVDQMIVIRGILTELFTDCQARYVLGDGGGVEEIGPVSCDGGSYVVVDGKTIRTSAGYVPAGQYYDRHNPALRPGQRVVVSATAASQTSAALTLNCARCGISLGG